MAAKEKFIKKKLKQLEELTGESQEGLERELIPAPGGEMRPLVTKKRRVVRG